jgi:hypothetical protein
MVPANSTGISPVPAYSGYPPLSIALHYGAVTLYGGLSHVLHVCDAFDPAGPITPYMP